MHDTELGELHEDEDRRVAREAAPEAAPRNSCLLNISNTPPEAAPRQLHYTITLHYICTTLHYTITQLHYTTLHCCPRSCPATAKEAAAAAATATTTTTTTTTTTIIIIIIKLQKLKLLYLGYELCSQACAPDFRARVSRQIFSNTFRAPRSCPAKHKKQQQQQPQQPQPQQQQLLLLLLLLYFKN